MVVWFLLSLSVSFFHSFSGCKSRTNSKPNLVPNNLCVHDDHYEGMGKIIFTKIYILHSAVPFVKPF